MYKRAYTCRCWRCWGRRTIRHKPDWYIRPRKCLACGTASLFIDKYRMRVEYAKTPCDCHGYGFKHRRGSGWCVHNKRERSDHDHEQRHGIRAAPF